MPSIRLSVKCPGTAWGESVGVVGAATRWDKQAPVPLTTSETLFPTWSCVVDWNKGDEYKFVIIKNGKITRWESDGRGRNRVLGDVQEGSEVHTESFGRLVQNDGIRNDGGAHRSAGKDFVMPLASTVHGLDALERSFVKVTAEQKSWRQRLSFVRSLFTEQDLAEEAGFDDSNIDSLVTVAVYLSFLASGQVPCAEDGGHHRPNHHAAAGQRIEMALARVAEDATNLGATQKEAYVPYVVRKIYPQLPSYSRQFTVSVPLTRIRDIAHRGDIPHDLKQEIKHSLQNKLHRCAGPEDLRTSELLLERISHGGYNGAFVEQFRIFHEELRAFFNASSLNDRLRYLKQLPDAREANEHAASLLVLKQERKSALEQLMVLTRLRHAISELKVMQKPRTGGGGNGSEDELPGEELQKVRLADIDLENYAFPLLAGVAKDVEDAPFNGSYPWRLCMLGLTYALKNMSLSGLVPSETGTAANEAAALAEIYSSGQQLGDVALMHRTKAAIDRALRFAESFSSAISDVYSRRVGTLGAALGVDARAMSVFAEAEIRSNLAFLASRIAGNSARMARKALDLPPWDPLLAGTARGRLIFADTLAALPSNCGDTDDDPVVVVCRDADGDEDIPVSVRGVVLGRSLPHLSHLGVRARQAGVVFVCADEKNAFERVWRNRDGGGYVTLTVDARRGITVFEKSAEPGAPARKTENAKETNMSNKPVNVVGVDTKTRSVLSLSKANRSNASSKASFAGKLATLAEESKRLFLVPEGVVVPHGVFQGLCVEHKKAYESLVAAYSSAEDLDSASSALRAFIQQQFAFAPGLVKPVQGSFKDGAQVMVRSSANAEDLEDMSGAGLYDSIANVAVADALAVSAAVVEVWSSLWTKRAASSRTACKVPHDKVSMAVLIQRMVPSNLSFVAFSRDPVSGDAAHLYVEVAVGMGETLASATSAGSPYRFSVNRESKKLCIHAFASYSDALVPERESVGGLRQESVDYSRQAMTTKAMFRTKLITKIAEIVIFLERKFGGPQDIEGAVVYRDGEPDVYVVQARPQIL